MDPTSESTPSNGVDETFADFASGSDRSVVPRVMPVIVQPVVPETTGAIASQANATVPRPSEGTIRVIDTAGLAELNFNFQPSEVHIAALDVDLVMVFSDNSKLILPNLAVSLLGANPPKLNFSGKPVAAQSVVAAISQVTLADATPSIHLASADFLPKKPKGPTAGDQESATGQDGIGGGEPPIPPQPIVSGGKFDNANNQIESKTGDFQTPPVREVTAGSISSGASNNAIANPSVVNTSTSNLEDALKVASFAFDTTVSARLLQTVGATTNDVNGVHQIRGATGQSPANTNSSYDVQKAEEILTGSAAGDEIWGDNPSYYPAGYAGRTVEITLPATGVTASSVTISGVPANVKILNATFIGNGVYEMLVDGQAANTFTMNIAYELPVDGTATDSNGFYTGSLFTMNFKFTGKNATGNTGTLTASAQIGIRDVTQESDQVSYDKTTGKLIIGLSKLPTGNIINGNEGDDTIHAAGGADIIDGGAGHNLVSYDRSNGAVSVDLTQGKGFKNFATGDTYVNVDDVVGSDYDDTLIGDGRDNILIGGKGADSIDGKGGTNTVSYVSSSSAVTVDLLSGAGTGGDAQGDRLVNIEAIIGSTYNDLLIGGNFNTTLSGGLGDDTIVSGIGADSLVGGDGSDVNNTLDYRNSGAGVNINLATGSASGGDATGDQFRNFRNVSGSAQADTITGDDNANKLSGLAGDDVFIASQGNDTIDGSADRDTIDYSSYEGGSGLQLTLNDSTSGNSLFNFIVKDTIVNIENVIGTRFEDTISGDKNNNSLFGGVGSDSLRGADGDDTLDGGVGADTLSGGTGNDVMDGGDGNNIADYRYLGSSANVTLRVAGATPITVALGNGETDILSNIENLIGSDGDNLLIGDSTKNSLFGGDGNDTFIVGGGGDYVDGGSGDNTVDFSKRMVFDSIDPNGRLEEATTGVSVSLVPGVAGRFGDAQDLIIANVNNLIGTSGNDTFIGNSAANRFRGGVGNDSLYGADGDDTLTGGADRNTLVGGAGNDSLYGSDGGSDVVDYRYLDGTAAVTLTLGSASNEFRAISSDSDQDTLRDIQSITLTSGADSVDLTGASGNLSLTGRGGADSITSGSGDDLIDASASSQAVRLSGNSGNDTLIGGTSLSDVADYSYLNNYQNNVGSVSIVATGATAFSATGSGGATDQDTITNIEIFTGSAGNDTMDMRNATGNLSLNGNGGDDLFFSGQGNDTIDGGNGSDTVDYSWLGTTKNITLTMNGSDGKTFSASNSTSGLVGSDTLINIEIIKLTANGDRVDLSTATGNLSLTSGGGGDTITTGIGNDFIDASASTSNKVSLSGGDGNDTLIGGSMGDWLIGGSGNDSLVGKGGTDCIDGGDGFDTVGYQHLGATALSVAAINSTTFGFGSEKLYNIEAIIGGDGNDLFNMAAVTDVSVNLSLVGNGGNDTFKSGAGSDTLSGGAGNDLYYVDGSTDRLIEGDDASSGNDTVYVKGASFNLATNGANVEQLYHRDYNGNYVATAFTGTGNALDNYIAGGTGNDSLVGGGGNDTFLWTGGNDAIDGESGNDGGPAGTNNLVDFSLVGTNLNGANLSSSTNIIAEQNGDSGWIAKIFSAAGALLNSVTLSNIQSIVGTTGNDTFKLGDGSVGLTVDGKAGNNTLDYSKLGSSTTASVDLSTGKAILSGASNRTDTGSNIQNATGGAGADTLIGDANANVFMGREGNDSINGDGGADTADYSYITTTSTLNGITVTLDNLNTVNVTGNANDQDTLVGIENIIGTAKADKIFGDGFANSLFGGDGADTLSGGAGADSLDGGGNAVGTSDMVDFTYVGAGKTLSIGLNNDGSWTSSTDLTNDIDTLRNFEAIKLSSGINTVNLSGIAYAVTIDGSSGTSNSIASGTGNDSLLGGIGNDTFSGNGGRDTIDGGASSSDTDLASYAYLDSGSAGVTVTVNSDSTFKGSVSLSVSLSDVDRLVNIEALAGSKNNDSFDFTGFSRAMSVAAGEGNDTLLGGLVNDTLTASGGNNFFDGGAGNNSMVGGSGNDSYFAHSVNDKISDTGGINFLQTDAYNVINLSDPNDPIGKMLNGLAGSGPTAPQWILQYRGAGDFSGTGDANNNSIYGWNGNDSLAGNAGNDYLDGYFGNNTINGGSGADTMVARGSGDNVFYQDDAGDRFSVIDVPLGPDGKPIYGNNTVITALSVADLSDSQNVGIRNLARSAGATGTFKATGSADANSIAGGDAADTLDGYLGNDTLFGGAGDDSLVGGYGDDSIDGGSGVNTLSYGYANGVSVGLTGFGPVYTAAVLTAQGMETDTFTNIQSISGSAGLDTIDLSKATTAFTIDGMGGGSSILGAGTGDYLLAGSGNDSILGGVGNDTLSGGGGNDTMDGGGGYNIADYGYTSDFITVGSAGITVVMNYATTTVSVRSGDVDTLYKYVGISGTVGNDSFVGDGTPNNFQGGLGNDTLDGGLGSDTADYSYIGTSRAPTLTSGVSVQLASATAVAATVSAGLDVDLIRNIENIIGSQFADSVIGDANANSIFGGAGNDIISGGSASTATQDTLDGGDGTDTFTVLTSAAGTVTLGEGASAGSALYNVPSSTNNYVNAILYNFENIVGGGGSETLNGNSSANLLDGNNGADSIFGGLGNDTLIGGLGNDTLDGGGQAGDTASYNYFAGVTGLSVTLGATSFSAIISGNETDTLSNIENIIGTKNNDTIIGDGNANTLDGGAGNDVTDYSYQTLGAGGMSITLQNGTTTTFNATEAIGVVDQLINFETLLLSNNADFVNLTGATSNLSLSGNDGDDSISGGLGNDTVSGGVGIDSLDGGGQAGDLITYAYLSSGVGISLALNGANAATTSGAEAEFIRNFENIIGSQYADSLAGDSFANSIAAGTGNDSVSGGFGADTLDGSVGIDTLDYSYVGDASNVAAGGGALTSGVTLTLYGVSSVSATIGGGAEIDQISNFENVTGSKFDDSITGDWNANTLVGNDGNDTLLGSSLTSVNTLNWATTSAFDNAAWSKIAATIIANQIQGPAALDSGTNADYLVASANNATFQNVAVTVGATYQLSLYAKAVAGSSWIQLMSGTGFDNINTWINFNLSGSGAIGNFGSNVKAGDYSITDAGNGWYLITLSSIATSSQAGGNFAFEALAGNSTSRYNFGGTGAQTVALYGASFMGNGDGNDLLDGGNGSDSINGGLFGDDTLIGGTGNDTLDGGSGRDIADYTYKTAGANYVARGQDTTNGNSFTFDAGSSDVDTLINIERINLGRGNNTVDLSALTSSNYTMIVDATQSGSVSMLGSAGSDTLLGSAGNDTYVSGTATDSIDFGGGIDVIDYKNFTTGVTLSVNGFSTTSLNFNLNNMIGGVNQLNIIRNVEAIKLGAGNNIVSLANLGAAYGGMTIDGGAGSTNSIIGSGGNDSILGGVGNDTLSSGTATADVDTLAGGAGDDLYVIGHNGDQIIEAQTGGIDTVQTTISTFTLGSIDAANGGSANNYIENLTFTGTSTFSGTGNELDNVITGGINSDVLNGGAGNDTLVGGGLRANSLTAPNAFDNAAWIATAASITADMAFGPSEMTALKTADQMVNSTADTWHFISGNAPTANYAVNSAYQTTFYVQNVNNSTKFVQIGFTGGGGNTFNLNQWINFDLTTGTFGNKGTAISNGDFSVTALANGWYQISLVGFTSATASALGSSYISILDPNDNTLGGTNSRLPGYAASSLSTINLWGGALQQVDISNDSLNGGTGNDSIFGGFGNDTLIGDTGNDTLDGGQGRDTVDYSYINSNSAYTQGITVQLNGTQTINVVARAGSDVDQLVNIENVVGTKYADSLAGDDRNNSLQGGDNADTLSGGIGNDTLDGGNSASGSAGIDWVDYAYLGSIAGQTSGVTATLNGGGGTATVSLTSPASLITNSDVDTLINIENIYGSRFADSLTGDGMNNSLLGGLGNDSLSGGDGRDWLDGNGLGGADTAALDVVSYAYVASTVNLTLDLNNFNSSTPFAYSVGGSTTDVDMLMNFEGIIGGAGNDSFVGDVKANYFAGGLGNDSFAAGAGNNTIDGGVGTDVADYSASTTAITTTLNSTGSLSLSGSYASGAYSDTLINIEGIIGSAGNDSVMGDAADNVFRGNAGNDTFDGGAGTGDIVDYSYLDNVAGRTTGISAVITAASISSGVTTYLWNTVNAGTGDVDQLMNVEGIIGTKFNDTLGNTGNANGTILRAGRFQVYAGAGNDYIYGSYLPGASKSVYDGGDDIDTLDLSSIGNTYGSGAILSEGTTAGSFNNVWMSGTIWNVENLIGASSADSLVGNSGANSIRGNGNNDTIKGMLGNDSLDGGGGSDVLDYSYVANTVNLSIDLTASIDPITSEVLYKTINLGTGDVDQYRNFEGVIGGAGNDTFIGGGAGGSFSGGAGTDFIRGGAGNDTISGGTGIDSLDGGGGAGNIVDYSYLSADQTISISFTNATTATANVSAGALSGSLSEIERLLNFNGATMGASSATLNYNASNLTAAQTVSGGYGNDSFIGGTGADSFYSAAGNDTVDGGLGNDSLSMPGANSVIYGSETVLMTGQTGVMTGNTAGTTVNFMNFERINLGTTNGASNNTLPGDKFVGSASTNGVYVFGWDGSDTLDDGGGTNMSLDGQADNDVYFIRSANTTVYDWTIAAPGAYGTVDLINTTLTSLDLSNTLYAGGTQIENLTYLDATASQYNTSVANGWNTTTLGSGNFTGLGNDLNNRITGGLGDNSLAGGAGADTLIGNIGNDTLKGGDKVTGTDVQMRFTNTNAVSSIGFASTTASQTSFAAPDGTNTAFLLANLASNNPHYGQFNLSTGLTMTNNTRYAATIYAHKAATNAATYILIAAEGSTNGSWIAIDLDKQISASGSSFSTSGLVYAGNLASGETYSIDYDAATGWYKISLTYSSTSNTTTGNSTGINFRAYLLDGKNGYSQTTYDGTTKTLGVLLWGNTLTAIDSGDSLFGDAGNDTIQGGNGNDTMDGGTGTDIADYSYLTTGVTLNLSSFSNSTATSVFITAGDSDWVSNFEGLVGGSGRDSLTGDANANYLGGGAGNDTLRGFSGNDTMDGGAGTGDIADYSYLSTDATLNLSSFSTSSATSVFIAAGDSDWVSNFEGLIGGSGNDSFTGDGNANYLGGGAGNDTLLGGLGNDTLSGGTGNDSLDGNGTASPDASAVDVLDYSYYATAMTVNVANINSGTTIGSGSDIDSVKNFEGIIGGSGNDSFTGDNKANYLDGGTGNDTLVGGGGADSLFGNTGNDLLQLDWSSINLSKLDGGSGTDTVSFTGSTGNATFSGAALSSVISNAEYLDFSGTSGTAALTLGGDHIQKILTGSSGAFSNAGVLDVKFDALGDSLTLATNTGYSYWNAANDTQLSGSISLSGLSPIGTNIFIYDSTHTTLLATLHYHT